MHPRLLWWRCLAARLTSTNTSPLTRTTAPLTGDHRPLSSVLQIIDRGRSLSLSLSCAAILCHLHPHTHKHMHAHSHSLLTCFLVLLQPSFASELTLQLFQDDEQIEAATTSATVFFGRTTFTYKSQQPLSVGGQVQCTFTVSTKQCVRTPNALSGPCYFPSFSPSFCAAAVASTPGPLH